MNNAMWKRAISQIALVVAVAGAANFGCYAEGPEYGGAGYSDGDYPPDAYIATADPFYYDGYATYWYGGRWYYRDGGRWGHYDREPPGLYQRRIQAAPRRRTYERPRGRAVEHDSRSPGERSGHH